MARHGRVRPGLHLPPGGHWLPDPVSSPPAPTAPLCLAPAGATPGTRLDTRPRSNRRQALAGDALRAESWPSGCAEGIGAPDRGATAKTEGRHRPEPPSRVARSDPGTRPPRRSGTPGAGMAHRPPSGLRSPPDPASQGFQSAVARGRRGGIAAIGHEIVAPRKPRQAPVGAQHDTSIMPPGCLLSDPRSTGGSHRRWPRGGRTPPRPVPRPQAAAVRAPEAAARIAAMLMP